MSYDFSIPLQEWEAAYDRYLCTDRLAAVREGKVPSVPAMRIGGRLAVMHDAFFPGRISKANARVMRGCFLVPEDAELDPERCPYRAARVRAHGKVWRLGDEGVILRATLPTMPPIPLGEAMQRIEPEYRTYGAWRARHMADCEPVAWVLLRGHPVAIYWVPSILEVVRQLFWRDRSGEVHLEMLDGSFDEEFQEVEERAGKPAQASASAPRQGSLF